MTLAITGLCPTPHRPACPCTRWPAGKRGRLRWTPQLHAQFVAAVEQLGGAFAATPKRILDVMGVPGITLLQIKSHVQVGRFFFAGAGV